MNVLLAAGPGATTLFTIIVQESGRPPARLAGRRHVRVSLNRLQSTHRRLLLAGATILSVTQGETIGDPPPFPHPAPRATPHGLSVSEAPGSGQTSPLPAPPAEETAPPLPAGQTKSQFHPGQNEATVGDNVMVLLLSVVGVVVLLTLQVARHLAQQWGTRSRWQHRPRPPVAAVQERGNWPTVEAPSERLGRSVANNTAPLIKASQHLGCGSDF